MARQDLGKIISEITEINATVDNGVGVPSATATITGTATEKIVNIDFKNLKGDKGDKPENGVDYFTPEEKKQFTAETVKLVTDEGTKQTGLVGEKGVAETGKLTAEGNKQINLVIAEANKVIEQLKSLIEGNPETSNAQTLSGKSRVEFERDTQALAGKYVGNFPLTVAVKDAVYLVPATGKFYVCTTAYNGTNLTAPNANFEELSVYKNRDKLENLVKIKQVQEMKFDIFLPIPYPNGFNVNNCFVFGIQTESQVNALSVIKLNTERTHYLIHKLTLDGMFNFYLCFIKIQN